MSEWKKIKIGEFLTESKVESTNSDASKRITVRLNCNGVEKRPLKAEKEGATKYYERKAGQFIYGRQNIHKGAFGVIPDELDGFTSSSDLPAFDVDESICLTEFLRISLLLNERYKTFQKNVKGVGSQRLSPSVFLNEEISIPPVAVQRNILKKLQSGFSRISTLSLECEKQREIVQKLRQNILQDAIEGKLTENWRKKHPVQKGHPDYDAEALFDLIQREKAKQKGISRVIKKNMDDMQSEMVINVPNSWLYVSLSDVGELARGKSKHRPRNDERLFKNGIYPFVQTGDVSQSKKFNFKIQQASKFYNEFGLSQSKIWPIGTLCITVAANIAETGFLTYEACFPDSVVGFTPVVPGAIIDYVKFYIDSIKVILEKFAPATAQKNINLGILESIKIPLPPLAEIDELVKQLNFFHHKMDQQEQQIATRETLAKQLTQSILKDAFEN